MSKDFVCLKCNHRTKKKNGLIRHLQEVHPKEFARENVILTQTSFTNKDSSLLRLSPENSLPNGPRDQYLLKNSEISSAMSKTNQEAIKPVVIKFVSKERRSLLEKNDVSKNTSEKLKKATANPELSKRSDSNSENKLVRVEDIAPIKTAGHGVVNTWLRNFDSPSNSPSTSPKKRVRWSELKMVMEDGHRKMVSLNFSDNGNNDEKDVENLKDKDANEIENPCDSKLGVTNYLKNEHVKSTKGSWILKGVKCRYCEFKSSEKYLLDGHEEGHTTQDKPLDNFVFPEPRNEDLDNKESKVDSKNKTKHSTKPDTQVHSSHSPHPLSNKVEDGNCFQCIKRQYLKRQYQDTTSHPSLDKTNNNDQEKKNCTKRRRKSSHRSSCIQEIETSVVLLKYVDNVHPEEMPKKLVRKEDKLSREKNTSKIGLNFCTASIEASNVLRLREELSDDVNSLSSMSSIEDSIGNLKGEFLKSRELYHQRMSLKNKNGSEQHHLEVYSPSHLQNLNATRNYKRLENWIAAQRRGFQQFEKHLRNQNMILRTQFEKNYLNQKLQNCSVQLKRFDR